MPALIVLSCLAAIIGLYFYNNPLGHGRWFMVRRFINWFPLGMTYAFLYMARYNLIIAKNALGTMMSNKEVGMIFAIGAWVYGLSFLVNGPLVDKIGGKKGIIIGAVGASVANVVLGVLAYLLVTRRLTTNMMPAFTVTYGVNMYFQSYGAVSIIKVKAYWFHVRERGVFGAIFGTLISLGIYFAFDWGQGIADLVRVNPPAPPGWFARAARWIFAGPSTQVDALWALFFIPAAILVAWALLDWWLIKDTPEEANFQGFDTCDASSGLMHIELTTTDLLKKVFASRLMLTIAFIGLAVGVLRNGIMNWYLMFAKDVKQSGSEFFVVHWGLLLCIFGIIGGFAGGAVSDKFFQSRRGPPVAILFAMMLAMTVLMSYCLFSSPLAIGVAAMVITMAATGATSLMSGTAAPDFGGRKATATCAGITDGFVYLGSGLQSWGVGYLTGQSWAWWPVFLMPFALFGGILAVVIWNELPSATRKFIREVEKKPVD